MSEAQQVIEKNYINLCNDMGLDPEDMKLTHEVYEAVRQQVYEWMYDYESIVDAGLDHEELLELKKEYKENKYERRYWEVVNGSHLMCY